MRLSFLDLTLDERRLYFEQAAIQRNISPVLMEKDFWVCWLLGILWTADVLPAAFLDWRCEVVALEVERSFWEKATILHTEYHRPAERLTPDRFSRHYADTAALAKHPTASKAIEQHDLRRRVVAWKSQFFGSSWANYDLARPGTFRIVPPAQRLPALRRDYQAMRDMYLTEPASFDEVLTTLADLENRINHAGSG